MGNKRSRDGPDNDVVHPLSIPLRVNYLIYGVFRNNINFKAMIPSELVALCYEYCGIDRNHDYSLIMSNTEHAIVEEEQRANELRQKEILHVSQRYQKQINDAQLRELKVIVLGAGAVGKSTITLRFVTGEFVEEYDPTIEDSYRKQLRIGKASFLYDVLDSAGQEEFRCMQDGWLRVSDVFVIVYSIASQASFEEAQREITRCERTLDEYREVPFILVGNKCDLHEQRCVPSQLAEEYVANHQRKNIVFMETSAKENKNVTALFEQCGLTYMKQALQENESREGRRNPRRSFLKW